MDNNMFLRLDSLVYDLSEVYGLDDSYFYNSSEKDQKIKRIKDNLVAEYNYYSNSDISIFEIKTIMDKRLCAQLIDEFTYTMNRLNGRNYYDECRNILYAIINTIMNNNCDLSYSFYDDDMTDGFGRHISSEVKRILSGSKNIFNELFNCGAWDNIFGLDDKTNLGNCSSEEDAIVRRMLCEQYLNAKELDDKNLLSKINLINFAFEYHINFVSNGKKNIRIK